MYRYSLLKGSKKIICPHCGKKTFVPFVDINGEIVGNEFGRCDRECKCGYFCKPDGNVKLSATERTEAPKEIPMSISPTLVETMQRGYKDSALYKYFCTLFPECAVNDVFGRYKVGGTRDGASVFWQIAKSGIVRAGKVMRYGSNGHRIKEGLPVRWVHKISKVSEYVSGKSLKQCFFGEHLLKDFVGDKVAMMESEKSALGMAIYQEVSGCNNILFLACGGAQNLKNKERNKVLNEYRVETIPDEDKYYEWRVLPLPYNWYCNSIAYDERLGDGCDIWDIWERAIRESKDGNLLNVDYKIND